MPASEAVKDKVKETATEEFERIRDVTVEAVQSRAYLYPIHVRTYSTMQLHLLTAIFYQGIWYLASHRDLWKPLLAKLVPTLTLGVGITSAMFLITYLPQAAILAFVDGPLAPFTAIPLVLSESSTLLDIISKNFLIGDALVDTFDGVCLASSVYTFEADGDYRLSCPKT